MKIAYRTYHSRPGNERIAQLSTKYFLKVLKREQAMTRYKNQNIQLIEAQVVSEREESEILRSIKIWNVTLDDQGFANRQEVSYLSTIDIRTIEQEMKLKNSDQLVQSYINVLLGEGSISTPEPTETITNRIWTVFKTLNPKQQAA
jgi:hypothetical protein